MIASLVATIFNAAPVQAQEGFDAIWARYGAQLEAEGISEKMARQAMHWTELQYHLGLCRTRLPAADVIFWREWWNDTPILRSEMGRMIIEAGNASYTEGLEAALSEPIPTDQCQRIFDSWMAEMRTLMARPE